MASKGTSLEIRVSRSASKLKVLQKTSSGESLMMEARIVSGCERTGTPTGNYKAGKWIKDKTNPVHGPKPWSHDKWGNPYGPYFMPLHDAKKDKYTTYGIHGTRGPLFGNFEKPPIPEEVTRLIIGNDAESAKYLYCSHGCIRLSNENIEKLYKLTTQPQFTDVRASIVIE